ncbi:MAG TPA: RNA polymerase sigma factor [Candidatus Acidoferrum sp.]|nr:RNA polymerase sigma factor [Candidatus Acidoferrum sp.]
MEILEKARVEGWTDEEVVDRVLAGETELYEIIMRRYNQRLYRVVISILRDANETEDVMQDAYVRAYEHLSQFEGRAAFSTWLTRIAVYEALARLRKRERIQLFGNELGEGEISVSPASAALDPEETVSKAELNHMLEEAVLRLPEQYRTVLVMRDVEEMSTSETAAALSLSEENVKVRLHRGRAMVRRDMFSRVGAMAKNAFPFLGERCDRVVKRVFERLSASKNDMDD